MLANGTVECHDARTDFVEGRVEEAGGQQGIALLDVSLEGAHLGVEGITFIVETHVVVHDLPTEILDLAVSAGL